MTRTGKIARLPLAIRDHLNRRLLDNEPGPSLLDWLNSLREVHAILAADFASQPVSPANLSQWKNGGYSDWLTRRDALALARDLDDEAALGDDSLAGLFADKLARWLSLHYASVAVQTLAAEGPDTRQRRLSQLCADVTALQREAHNAQRIGLERERLQIQLSNAEWQRKKDIHQAELRALDLQSLRDALASATPAPAPPPANTQPPSGQS